MPITNQAQAHRVAHCVLNANHRPATSPQGGTLSAECQSQAIHKLTRWHTGCLMPITNHTQTRMVAQCATECQPRAGLAILTRRIHFGHRKTTCATLQLPAQEQRSSANQKDTPCPGAGHVLMSNPKPFSEQEHIGC